MAQIASRAKWVWGTDEANSAAGSANNRLGSTGAGATFNTHGWGMQFAFFVETDAAATCSYQIRAARTSSGPWNVLSSGTLGTSAIDIVQLPGPLGWLSPRLKTLNSTANFVVMRMTALDP